MSFTVPRSSLLTLKPTTKLSFSSSFGNNGSKSLVSILHEASISLFSSDNSNNKKKKEESSQQYVYNGIAGVPGMKCHEYNHDVFSKITYQTISIHGMTIRSGSVLSPTIARQSNSYNLQLIEFPIELENDLVVQDDDDQDHQEDGDDGEIAVDGKENESNSIIMDLSKWLISTLKRRKKKMNKHKLRKRRKLERLKGKK
jgi:hypothetical protein